MKRYVRAALFTLAALAGTVAGSAAATGTRAPCG